MTAHNTTSTTTGPLFNGLALSIGVGAVWMIAVCTCLIIQCKRNRATPQQSNIFTEANNCIQSCKKAKDSCEGRNLLPS